MCDRLLLRKNRVRVRRETALRGARTRQFVWARTNSLLAAALIVASGASTALGQWTASSQNAGTTSQARGGSGNQFVGYAVVSGAERATYWSRAGTNFLSTTMQPAGATSSRAIANSGSAQAGYAVFGGVDRAGTWQSSAGSWLSLHPAIASGSRAQAISTTGQAGYAVVGGAAHAARWSGSAASFVDLHPTVASESKIWGVSGNTQVGEATISGARHAGLWSGSAASFIDLHPAGADASQVWGVDGARQAGHATIAGADHAALWTSTSSSFVDLHPAGATSSQAVSIYDRWLVGYATIGGTKHAVAWTSTNGAWEDLSLVLTAGQWGETVAQGVYTDGNTLYVSGYGYSSTNQRYEAVLWKRQIHPWITTVLHPAGALRSRVLAVSEDQEVGYMAPSQFNHAALWRGTAESFVDLNVSGLPNSNAYAVENGKQYGTSGTLSQASASVWTGLPSPVTNLFTGTYLTSIRGVSNGQLVGQASNAAVYWPSAQAARVVLAATGIAEACHGDTQVGTVANHAALWKGTAASFVDLDPSGNGSAAHGVYGNQQVGEVLNSSGQASAALWNGTAQSLTLLAASLGSSSESRAFGVHNGVQVGAWGTSPLLWHGTPDSYEFLPLPNATYFGGVARAVWNGPSSTRIGGYLNPTGNEQAVLWSRSKCGTPEVLTQPESATIGSLASTTVSLTPATLGIGTLTYQWQWRLGTSSAWQNVVSGLNTGQGGASFIADNPQTATLTVTGNGAPSVQLNTKCVLTSPCGSADSNQITIGICAADFNNDGFIDFNDFDEFVAAFEAGDVSADYNNDGFIDFTDFDEFVSGFEAGC